MYFVMIEKKKKKKKEKLSDISTDHRGTYNKFKDEDRCAIGKYAAIHGTAAALEKFNKLHPHYRLTESLFKTMRDKYRRIVKSSPTANTITSLKRGRLLMLGSLDGKMKRFLLTLRSKGGVVNIVVSVEVAKALIAKCFDESLKVLDLDNSP